MVPTTMSARVAMPGNFRLLQNSIFNAPFEDATTDAEVGGNPDTSINRNHPHDYVLPSFTFTNLLVASAFPSHSFSNGLVFDSRVYTPLSDVPPIEFGDSSNAQHMAVLKDFRVAYGTTNSSTSAPMIITQPQSHTVNPGDDVTFLVLAWAISSRHLAMAGSEM